MASSFVSRFRQRKFKETNEFNGPACSRMKNFIEEAHKKQTLFANTEGSYKRRKIESNKVEDIEELVELMFNFECLSRCHKVSSTSKRLAQEMKKLSDMYGMCGEVHFAIVWVYYYEYESWQTKWTPLFRVFQNEITDDSTFIDMNFKQYSRWEEFLDTADLPKSFVCVPRTGTYTFDRQSEKLDLIYIRSPSSKKPSGRSDYSYRPFCETFYQSICRGVKDLGRKVVSTFELVVRVVCDIWNDKEKLITIVLFAVGVAINIYSYASGGMTPAGLTFTIDSYFKMLCNVINRPEEGWDIVRNEILNAHPGLHLVTKLCDALECAAEKRWNDALDSLQKMVIEDKSSFVTHLEKLPLSPNTKYFVKTARTLSELISVGFDSLKKMPVKSEGAGVNSTNAKDDDGSNNPVIIEKLLEEIQKNSGNRMAAEIVKEAKEKKELLHIPVTSDFSESIYVFDSGLYSDILDGLKKLFKDFRIRPKHSMVHEVYDADEKNILATLYLVDENSAFLWVRDPKLH